MPKKKPDPQDRNLGQQLAEAWDDNEEIMGEQAAFLVSCEQLGISEERGYELLGEMNDD